MRVVNARGVPFRVLTAVFRSKNSFVVGKETEV